MPTLARLDRGAAPAAHGGSRPQKRRSWWWWGRHVLTLGFLVLVAVLLVEQASTIEWDKVLESIRSYTPATMAMAAGLTVVSHLLFGGFDQLGKNYVGHRLGRAQVALIAGACYAFTLNLGALVGGVGFRYRLYSRLGLSAPDITKVYAMSVVTNWLGYLLLLGAILLWGGIQLPRQWGVPAAVLPIAGVAAWAVAAAYFVMCAGLVRRKFTVRDVEVAWPGWRMASVQTVMSIANWLAMGLIIYLLLGGRVEFPIVLGVLLISAVAGAVTHVPAGLGVLETVFLALLSGRVPAHEVLAALLAYRAIYYLCPLIPALASYAYLEARARR